MHPEVWFVIYASSWSVVSGINTIYILKLFLSVCYCSMCTTSDLSDTYLIHRAFTKTTVPNDISKTITRIWLCYLYRTLPWTACFIWYVTPYKPRTSFDIKWEDSNCEPWSVKDIHNTSWRLVSGRLHSVCSAITQTMDIDHHWSRCLETICTVLSLFKPQVWRI